MHEDALEERIEFIGLDRQARRAIRALEPIVADLIGGALDEVYLRTSAFEPFDDDFSSPEIIAEAKAAQAEHWRRLAEGKFDAAYAKALKRVRRTFARLGLPPDRYIAGQGMVVERMVRAVLARAPADAPREAIAETLAGLVKAVFLDLDFSVWLYVDALEAQHREATEEPAGGPKAEAALRALGAVMSRAAAGDLSARLELEVPAELQPLKAAANAILGQLVDARRDADAAERAKADFLSKVSREIRTPLNGVIGVASALSATDLTAAQSDMVDLIKGSAETVEQLFADIVDVAVGASGAVSLETGAFELKAVVEAAVAPFRVAAAEKAIGLGLRFVGDEDARLVGDAARLSQLVANLVANAVKFTDEGGVKIQVVCAEAAEEPGTVDLTIEVSDTGIGFEANVTAHIFDRFGQADASITRRFGGAGLGLAVAKSIADAMHGEICATSTPGRGSQFVVSLRLPRSIAAAAADPAPAGAAPSGRPQVLLAEDHPINRKVVRMILDPIGVEVVEACDGADAVRRFAEGAFDVVLMDIHMPVMDGLTATKAIRQIESSQGRKPSRVVMLTADAGESHRRAAKEIGADDHMPKPVQRERLIASVLSVLKDADG